MTGDYEFIDVRELAAAVLRDGVRETGPDYMNDPCARWWCDVLGLTARFLYDEACRIRKRTLPYSPRSHCVHAQPRDSRGRFKRPR